MGDLIVRAKELENESERKLCGWGFFYYKEPEYEAAAHLLHEAANCYKAAKYWDEAAATYIKLAECHLKIKRSMSLLPILMYMLQYVMNLNKTSRRLWTPWERQLRSSKKD
ncbi:hypothetical protein ACLB2K_019384 [Fragaria x ananassa]